MLGVTARKWARETAQLVRVRMGGEAQMAIELEEIPQRWEGTKAALQDRIERSPAPICKGFLEGLGRVPQSIPTRVGPKRAKPVLATTGKGNSQSRSPGRNPASITCFKCQGIGHMPKECSSPGDFIWKEGKGLRVKRSQRAKSPNSLGVPAGPAAAPMQEQVGGQIP